MQNFFMPFIFSYPLIPTIKTHYCIIEIDTCFARKVVLKTEIDINDGVNESEGINSNIFNPAKVDACDACNHRDIFG